MPYESRRTGQYYLIVCNGRAVRSPLSRQYLTGYRLLADDLCEDLNRSGLPDAGTVSLGALHATYLDRGANVPRTQLESDVLTRYDRMLDFALHRPQERTVEAMMSAWFGPVVPHDTLRAWLRRLSVRQLVSALETADATGSVLVAYRLLRNELTAPRLAAGVRKYDRDRGYGVSELTLILEQVRRYAQVPEEPELIAPARLEFESDGESIGAR
jgi:hypothetical protein